MQGEQQIEHSHTSLSAVRLEGVRTAPEAGVHVGYVGEVGWENVKLELVVRSAYEPSSAPRVKRVSLLVVYGVHHKHAPAAEAGRSLRLSAELLR